MGYPQIASPRKGSGIGKALIVVVSLLVLVGIAVVYSRATSGQVYANESYVVPPADANPPALPTVTNASQATTLVTDNALYGLSIPSPTRCEVTAIDLAAASDAELTDHMNGVIACLMRVWDLTVTHAGYTMPRPPLVIFSTPTSTACGKLTMQNAAYCSADQKIYYATDLPDAIPTDLKNSRFVVEVIVAHEFAHAVQARTAILTAEHGLEEGASTAAAAHEWSRRVELQADCFAGLFIHSVSASAGMTQQDLDNIASLMVTFGDDSSGHTAAGGGSHGTGANRKYWAQLGLASTSLSVCNTFVATSDAVS